MNARVRPVEVAASPVPATALLSLAGVGRHYGEGEAQVRALDNVLDVTFWPLEQQRAESAAKRRIGVGFTGMGNALAMLCLRYNAAEGREMATRIATHMRDAAYRASVALAVRLSATGAGVTGAGFARFDGLAVN